jgi:hypothetical protein
VSNNLQLLVGGVDLSSKMETATWSITQQWSRQGDSADFTLMDEHPDRPYSLSYTVPPLTTISLKDVGLNQMLFSGIVSQPELYWEGPNLARWHLVCRDWTFLADMTIVTGDFMNMTADAVILALMAQFPSGLTHANVLSGPLLVRAKVPHKSMTSMLAQVEKLSSTSGAQFGFYVDENKDLHFYDQTRAVSSGIIVSDRVADALALSTNVCGRLDRNWHYSWDGTSIRNDVLVRGANLSASRTDSVVADGHGTDWVLTFPVDTSNTSFALTVNGSSTSVSLDTGGTPTTQYVVTKAATALVGGQWFLRTGLASTPASGTVLSLTYNYIQPVESEVVDWSSVSQFSSLPNGGRLQMYIADPALLNLIAAKDRGIRELAEYSVPQERIDGDVTEDFTGHIRAGQTIELRNGAIPDSKAAYAPGLDATFLVISNSISGKPGINRRYNITGVRVS